MVDGPVFSSIKRSRRSRMTYVFLILLAVMALACHNKTVGTKGNFGLAGDGKKDDTQALQKILQRGGKIVIPKGTYKISSTIIVNPEVLEVSAHGATFVAAPNSTYNLISVQSPNKKLIWRGGTFDGNKARQTYPGHPDKQYDGPWRQTVTNNGMIGNQNFEAEYVLLEEVILRNFVPDGSCIRADIAEFRNCKAFDSAFPFEKYPQALKFRSDGIADDRERLFRVSDCYAENVYIGLGVAAKEVGKKTFLEVDGFESIKTGKSSIHLEHISVADIKNIKCLANGENFSSRIHIGNQNEEFRLESFELEGGFIRGPKRSKALYVSNGKISNSQKFDYAIRQGNKTEQGQIKNVTIENCRGGIKAKEIIDCQVKDASGCAIEGARLVDQCVISKAQIGALNCKAINNTSFSEVQKGIQQSKGFQQITKCRFTQCVNPVIVGEKTEGISISDSDFTDWEDVSIKINASKTVRINNNQFTKTPKIAGKLRAGRGPVKAEVIEILTPGKGKIEIENNQMKGVSNPFHVPQMSKQKLLEKNKVLH